MTNVTINQLPTASTIDPTQDILPIYTAASQATQGISRNTFLGLSSAPVGLTDIQTLQNKQINNSNSATLKDASGFTLQHATDTTRQLQFNLAAIPTSTTQTLSIPNGSDTLVTLGATQTLTNKTLTSPTINTPAISNATITADTVSGFTTSNNGTIYGMSVTGGVLASAALANAVNTTAIQAGAVGPSNLATNAITLGYAQITTGFNTSATTATQVTGLTVSVTIPSGGRAVKISVYTLGLYATTGGDSVVMTLWDGTVGSGTQLQQAQYDTTTGVKGIPIFLQAHATPGAGSKTYNVGLHNGTAARNVSLEAGATFPAFILVEAI